MLRRAPCASLGNLLSSSTRLRRISMILGTCSISTGHSCWQAPQATQDQISSSLIASPISFCVCCGARRVPDGLEEVLPGIDDDHLGVERLAGEEGGALLLAAAAFRTGVEIQQILPGPLRDGAHPVVL